MEEITTTFDSLGLDPTLLQAIRELDFTHPTAIQAKAIPLIFSGRDVVGCAQTGTGKTAAFLLPVLHRYLRAPRAASRMLILEPTRELAAQVEVHFHELAKHTKLRAASVYGGVGFGNQTKALKTGYDVIVATPGRLLDHMNRGHSKFEQLDVLVLDEADRMLDMGFLPDLKRIVQRLPKKRQTLLFSATMPAEILRLAHEILRDPVQIDVGHKPITAVGITHAVYPVAQGYKLGMLSQLLRQPGMDSVLVFTRTKHRADRLSGSLQIRGFNIAVVHGNRTQSEREHALDLFRAARVQVLVATDIAARGLDIEGITHVINYDVPNTPEDYVHRTGRTARAEAEGDAFTLVSPEEEAAMRDIEKALGKPLPRVILPDFDYGPFTPSLQSIAPAAPPPPPAEGMHSTRRPLARRRRL